MIRQNGDGRAGKNDDGSTIGQKAAGMTAVGMVGPHGGRNDGSQHGRAERRQE
jgi:hypothetical protein